MDWQAIQIGVMELVVAAVVGLAVVYGSYRLFGWLTPGFDEEEEVARDNRAAAIALGGSLIAVALIVREAIYPITATVQDLAEAPWSAAAGAKAVGYAALYLAITAAVAFLTIALTMRLFTALTRDLDERVHRLHQAADAVYEYWLARGKGAGLRN